MQCIKRSTTINVINRQFRIEGCSVRYNSWRVVFFGSDSFSVVHLNELLKQRNKGIIQNLEVVTTSFQNLLYNFSISKNIKVHLWPPDLKKIYDIGVVASFGKMIPKHLIEQFPLGIINVHASLLPKWRGSAPIIHAIKNGDKITGVTIHMIRAHTFDTGDIILQKCCPIGENELMPSLYNKLCKCGSECLAEVISDLPQSIAYSVPQTTENISFAKKIDKSMSVVRWNDMTAKEVYNLYRALFGLHHLTTTWHGIPVKLLCMSMNNSYKSFGSPGSVEYLSDDKVILVNCKDKPIGICSVLVKGKIMKALDFYRGFITQICPAYCAFK